ncbi:MAG: hypothetical protein EWM72_01636 [Nitrospira sp.]|nr:MAG: hypothetical protein EWM72_01636 [Nitrospira sp.]
MNADGEFSIDGIVVFHLRIERPLAERRDAGLRQLPMFAWFQDNDRYLGLLRYQQAGFHPIVEFLAIERGGNTRPWRRLRNRPQLLIFVQREAVDMDLG